METETIETRAMKELDVYTERDLAGVFGVSLATVRRWRRIGKLNPTGFTPGRKPLYSRAYVRSVCDDPTPAWYS